MNTDNYFEIGSSHLVCQDYALSGTHETMHYAIVSDGCSSAEHSEIGAQILCHAARYNLCLYYELFKANSDISTIVRLLGNSVIKRADEVRKLYPISYSALQATLLIAVIIDTRAYMFGWGDGYVVIKSKGFGTSFLKIEYPETNAPFYLCTDRKAYEKAFGSDKTVLHTRQYYRDGAHTIEKYSFYEPFIDSQEHGIDTVEAIAVCTDGLSQYLDKDVMPVNDKIIVPMIMDFPEVTNGEFLKRTMNFMKRDIIKKGWSHRDDVGIAAIVKQ